MDQSITGKTIRELREKAGFTQNELAERLHVTDKAISKWETGRGLPDVSLWEELARALQVTVAELLKGEYVKNSNAAANLKKSHFYYCSNCGNILFSVGEAELNCCGETLKPLLVENTDPVHDIQVEKIGYEYYVTVPHEMTKEHYISFIALLTGETLQFKKCYPEGPAEAYFKANGHGKIYACCNTHGLMEKLI